MTSAVQDTLSKLFCKLQERDDLHSGTLLEHLNELVMTLMESKESSTDVAATSIALKRRALQRSIRDLFLPVQIKPDVSQLCQALSLFGDPQPPIHPETGVVLKQKSPYAYTCENLPKLAWMLEELGTGVNRAEMYGVQLQLKALGEDPDLKLQHVRFFGKIFGIYRDYYIFEGTPEVKQQPVQETEEERRDRELAKEFPMEQGSGVNSEKFFVCNQIGDPNMIKLPDIRPEQIRAARHLKKLLTGDLNSAVSTYPPFQWNEAVLLRAQIARISCTTVLSPNGWFSQEENDSGESFLVKSEEIEPVLMPEKDDPSAWLENWVHRREHLKRQGRCKTARIHELEEDEDEDETQIGEDESEEPPEGGQVLASVSGDSMVFGQAAWTILQSSSSMFVKGQVLGLRSNLWPGAVALTHGKDCMNLYVGWAVKNAPFVPLPPPPVSAEYDQGQVMSVDMPVKPDPDAPPPQQNEEENDDEQ